MYDSFIKDFLRINPRPSKRQAEALMMSLGISDFECPNFVPAVLKASRKNICALTEAERVLVNDYDPATTPTDNLLLNDGDNLTNENQLGDQDALSVDGVEDTSSIDDFEAQNNSNDGVNSL